MREAGFRPKDGFTLLKVSKRPMAELSLEATFHSLTHPFIHHQIDTHPTPGREDLEQVTT